MKKLRQILTVILALTIFASCDKKDDNGSKGTLEKETISAKWLVDGLSDYESFEFNKSGNYIVVKNTTTKSTNSQIVLFGSYVIVDDKTITLSDFGTIAISEIDDNSISFSIKLSSNPGTEIIINASKEEEMKSTTRTDLICKTWEMVSVNGEDVAGTEYELNVLFSQAGTYFVEFPNPEYEGDGGLAYWKWKDKTESKFLYSWENPPVWDEEDEVEIIELTDKTLKILDRFDDEEDELYVLKPASGTKSAHFKTEVNRMSNSGRKGFLKR